ncbi:hypothetical protein JCM10207_005401 [Rhodosporidiobolus poonsookiae]
MLAQTPRRAVPRLFTRHASTGGSSPTPIRSSGAQLVGDAKQHSNMLVFGGLGAVGAGALWWMMAEEGDAKKPPTTQGVKPAQG